MVLSFEKGSVTAVLAAAKQRNVPLLISVHHPHASRLEYLDDAKVVAVLEMTSVVCMELEVGTPDCDAFSAFMPIARVPSCFIINPVGQPLLAVQKKHSSAESLASAVRKALGVVEGEDTTMGDAPTKEANAVPEQTAKNPLTKEEILARIEKKRVEKIEEEKATAIKKEVKRRAGAKKAAEARQAKEDLQARAAAEERKRIKREDQLAKERVRKQIADDKKDRLRREEERRRERAGAPPAEAVVAQRTSTSSSNIASSATTSRLRFRLPSGETHTHVFDATSSIGDVRRHVAGEGWTEGAFNLVMTFPTRTLDPTDDADTLKDHSLAPTGSLLVTQDAPGRGSRRVGGARQSLGALIWGYFSAIFAFLGSINPFTQQQPSQPPVADSRARRQGRFGRIQDDPDDKRATYNGNSTTQE